MNMTRWLMQRHELLDWSVEGIDAAVKHWLKTPLFELGLRGFEESLEGMPLPWWAEPTRRPSDTKWRADPDTE